MNGIGVLNAPYNRSAMIAGTKRPEIPTALSMINIVREVDCEMPITVRLKVGSLYKGK